MPSEPANPVSPTSSSICEHCRQILPKSEEWKRRRFRWGMWIALLTFIPYGVSISSALRTISYQKATGMGAVAGGLSEVFVTFGLVTMLVLGGLGVVLLLKGLSPNRPLQVMMSVAGIAWFGFVVASTVLTVALMIILQRNHP